jgi:hypothetical protein
MARVSLKADKKLSGGNHMKLPDISYKTRVTPFSKRNVFVPAAEANTKSAIAGAVMGAAGAIGSIADKVYERQKTIDRDTGTLKFKEKASQIQEELDNRKTFTASELPPELRKEGKEIYPSYEVKAALYKRKYTQAVHESAQDIYDSQARQDFINKGLVLTEGLYQNALKNDVAEQQKYEINTADALWKQLMLDGNIPAAIEKINSMPIREDEKENRKLIAYRHGEEHPYNVALLSENVINIEKAMYDAKAKIDNPEKNKSRLSEDELRTWYSTLRSARERINNKEKAELQAALKGVADKGRNMLEELKAGIPVPAGQVNSMRANLTLAGQDNLAYDIGIQQQVQPVLTGLSGQRPEERNAFINSAKKEIAKDENGRQAWLAIKRSVDEMNRMNNADPVSYGNTYGLTKPVPFDMSDISGTIKKLRANEQVVLQATNRSKGIFDQDSAYSFSKWLSALPASQKASGFAQIEAAFDTPGESKIVYDQLKQFGINDSLMVAGRLYASGNKIGSELVVNGKQARLNNPKMLREIDKDLNDEIINALGTAYNIEKPEIMDAVKDTYVAMIMKSDATDEDKVSPDGIEDDILVEAVRSVTGGLQDINGRMVQPAYHGQAPGELEDFIDRINDLNITQMGSAKGFAPSQIVKELKDGNLQLVSTGYHDDKGGMQYNLYYTKTNQYIHSKDGTLFNFKYIPPTEHVQENTSFGLSEDVTEQLPSLPSIEKILTEYGKYKTTEQYKELAADIEKGKAKLIKGYAKTKEFLKPYISDYGSVDEGDINF